MGTKAYVNGRGISSEDSGGQSIVFPDVCKTPSPGGPIPIPYPNIGRSADADKGPKTVTVNGKMPMVKGAQYKTSTGDEAGTARRRSDEQFHERSSEFMMYSFDVKFEGKNVCRLGDRLLPQQEEHHGVSRAEASAERRRRLLGFVLPSFGGGPPNPRSRGMSVWRPLDRIVRFIQLFLILQIIELASSCCWEQPS